MAITALPTAPQRIDSPDVFATKADAWVASLDLFTTEANALQTDVNNKQTLAAASEAAAELAETNAKTAQVASEAARDISIANASGTVATGSAKDWASKAEDSEVITGQYSALHWAAKAAASIAVLPEGTINDGLTALDKTWSSSKIAAEILTAGKIDIIGKNSGYTVLSADKGKIVSCISSFTLSLTSATNLGAGWFFYAHNVGTGNITIDPNGSETIDTQSNVILEPDNFFLIICDGAKFKCVRLNNPQPHYITASKTWTCPAGVYKINVELWGAGGGGSYNSGSIRCGGNGGAYAKKKITISPGINKVITIGIGGSPQTTNASNGISGGSSSFGSDITCSGGAGGAVGSLFTWPTATSSGGDINVNGGMGYYSGSLSFGGSSFGSCFALTTNVYDGNYPGGGAPGSLSYSPTEGRGADGLCIIWY